MSDTARVLAAVPGLRRATDLDPEMAPRLLEAPQHIVATTEDVAALLPHGGLSTVTMITAGRIGATSLLWRLLAGPSSAGAWCAVVGLERLYPLSARAAGVDLERLALVEAAGPRIVDAAGALASGIPVLAAPSAAFTPAQARRLAAKCRRSGTAIVWWESRPVAGADARLEVTGVRWQGLRANAGRRYGAGRLTACELDVAACWRSGLTRRARIWPYGRGTDLAVSHSSPRREPMRAVQWSSPGLSRLLAKSLVLTGLARALQRHRRSGYSLGEPPKSMGLGLKDLLAHRSVRPCRRSLVPVPTSGSPRLRGW